MNKKRQYEVTVPVTHYEKIIITPDQMISVLRQEIKHLIGCEWDGINLEKDGSGHYFRMAHTSHSFEVDGPKVDEETLILYTVLNNTIKYFKTIEHFK